MFADRLLLHLFLFGAAQAAALLDLRTGRTWLGATITVSMWLLLDWWLLARYVYGLQGIGAALPLALLQVVCVLTVVAHSWAQWRRRWSAAARSRAATFSEALVAYMRDDHAAARAALRRLVWSDPWDAAAWLLLGDVHAAMGEPARAKWCYRRARGVDRRQAYADLLRHRLGALRAKSRPAAQAQPSL